MREVVGRQRPDLCQSTTTGLSDETTPGVIISSLHNLFCTRRILTWRKAAKAEKMSVGLAAREREMCVFGLSGPSDDPEIDAKRLRGTAHATGIPAMRLNTA